MRIDFTPQLQRTWVAAGATVAIGGVKFFEGLSSKKKDEKELNSLHQPFYQVQSEYFQNRNLAEQQAGQGLNSATKQYQTQEAQRGLSAGLGDILKAGGDVNDTSMLLSQYNNSLSKTAGEDAQQHAANIGYFMNANKDLAGQKTTQWSINEYQPYEAKLKELKQNVGADKQNEIGGLTTAAGGLTAGITGNQNASLIKKLLAKTTPEDPYLSGPMKAHRDSFNPGLANASMGGDPAAGMGSIDPNTFSRGALVTPQDTSDNY